MVASVNTVYDVMKIIMKYVPVEKIPNLVKDLSEVEGNASFIATIQRLQIELQKHRES
jgi:hypothetical protein